MDEGISGGRRSVSRKTKIFICKQCGSCCRWPGYVFLTNEDVAVIAEQIDLAEREFIDSYTRLSSNRGQLSLVEKENGECVFLDGSVCRIYKARPRQCRDFPGIWHVEGDCPGFGRPIEPPD